MAQIVKTTTVYGNLVTVGHVRDSGETNSRSVTAADVITITVIANGRMVPVRTVISEALVRIDSSTIMQVRD